MLTHLRGKFIVFDGTEGCGKSTQAALLRDALAREAVDALLVRDPGTTRIGEMVRGILLDPDHGEMGMRCEMLLYMAARAQMMVETIRPALDAGRAVISDRFVSSTLAYQLGGDGLSAADIRAVADVAIAGRWPDVTVLLDLPAEASMARVKPKKLTTAGDGGAVVDKDRIERRPIEYHRQVRENYLAQAKADPARYRVVDATRTIDAVHADVLAALAALPSPGVRGEG
ncbi:MAG TPA: dTMP kinase [Tepidisphaeraceae bacterium]|nr:dTMP kinase [Tepidisphaeraceae bacterium]